MGRNGDEVGPPKMNEEACDYVCHFATMQIWVKGIAFQLSFLERYLMEESGRGWGQRKFRTFGRKNRKEGRTFFPSFFLSFSAFFHIRLSFEERREKSENSVSSFCHVTFHPPKYLDAIFPYDSHYLLHFFQTLFTTFIPNRDPERCDQGHDEEQQAARQDRVARPRRRRPVHADGLGMHQDAGPLRGGNHQ